MGDELPILKGILNGVVNYHNAPVRFGRVPKREKARILAAMQQSSNSRSQEKTLIAELDDEQRLMATIIRAHIDTCDFTREKMEPLMNRAREKSAYVVHSGSLICPLNPDSLTDQDPQNFSKRFSPAIRNVVEFAKRIPGFQLLNQEDQVTLLKAGTFEVLLVRLCCLFDSETSSMLCVNGQLVNREMMHGSSNARFLMDSMFDFAERFNMFHLTEPEIALYCAIVICAPDRPGLRNVELIERMQMKMKSTLQLMINQSHPGHHEILQELIKKMPDLRTLNTLHCERLLDCKLSDHEQYSTIHHIWMSSPPAAADDENLHSNKSSESWSADGMTMVIDDAKSPQGSVSSTESLNSGEIAAANMTDYHHHQKPHVSAHASSAPLLAATLAGNICPLRHSQPSNGAGCSSSVGGDDEMPGTSSRLVQNDLTITPVVNRLAQQQSSNRTYVKVDSPTDSGIESDKTASSSGSSGGSSPPTSLCGSPRSSLEDHAAADEKHNGHSSIVDMPVLKRALQAPPLYDTTSLMDEAYKPHKKFRALRNAKDSAEADPIIVVSPPPMQLQQSLQYQPQKQQQSQLQMHLANSSQSSLSSTHSTLAKSLMEGPRMTAEQMKRTDIIHNYIMRGEAPSSPNNQHSTSPLTSAATTTCPYKSPNAGNLLLCATSTMNHNYHYASSSSQQQHWPEQQRNSNSYVNNGTSVITTTTSRPISSSSYVLMQNNSTRVSPSPPQQIYFRTQSPPHSSTSPAPTVKQQPTSPPPSSPAAAGVVVVAPQSAASRIVELQLDIADSQQPLNLSKKSPSPMPRPLSAPTAMHKAVSLEA